MGTNNPDLLRADRKSDVINVCLIGAGRRAEILAKALPPNAKIISVCAKTMESAQTLAVKFDAKAVSYDDVMNDYNAKVAIVAVPFSEHDRILLDCAQCYKHVFIEKPGPTSSYHANYLRKLFLKNGLVARVGYSWLDEAWTDVLPKLDFTNIDIRWQKDFGDLDPALNLAVHPIAWLLSRAGKEKIKDVKINMVANRILTCSIEWENRQTAFIRLTSYDGIREREIDLQMKEGSIVIQDDGTSLSNIPGQMTSAEKQIRQFIVDVQKGKLKGLRDLKFSSRVLDVIGRTT